MDVSLRPIAHFDEGFFDNDREVKRNIMVPKIWAKVVGAKAGCGEWLEDEVLEDVGSERTGPHGAQIEDAIPRSLSLAR